MLDDVKGGEPVVVAEENGGEAGSAGAGEAQRRADRATDHSQLCLILDERRRLLSTSSVETTYLIE